MTGSRRKARELALQMLFQYDIAGNDPETVVLTFEELQKARPPIRDFAIRIFQGTVEHLETIDGMIVAQAENWRISRMAVVDRNIIRMSNRPPVQDSSQNTPSMCAQTEPEA